MREQYRLKHRIVRFLVERMGFTHVAIEDSLYGAFAIDDYVKGADIPPEEALRGTAGWYLWDTEEMLDFIRWMKAHNDGVPDGKKVSYVGLDIQDARPGIEHLRGYFRGVDPAYAASFESYAEVLAVFDKPIWIQVQAAYSKLEPSKKEAIAEIFKDAGARLEARRAEYTDAAGEKAYSDALLVASHLLKSHEHFIELEEDDDGVVGIREKAMFDGVVRLKETAGPGARIVVWVHNAHAAKSPVRFLNTGIPESARLELLGTLLVQKYGDDVKSIGMASVGMRNQAASKEPRPDLLDHVLSRVGLDLFLLDLAGLESRDGEKGVPDSPWTFTADMGGFLSLVPATAYDGLVFVKYVTGVRRSPEAMRRFNTLFGK
jgi:erythromycin esterase